MIGKWLEWPPSLCRALPLLLPQHLFQKPNLENFTASHDVEQDVQVSGWESPYLSKRTCLSHSSIVTLHPNIADLESPPPFSYVPTALIPTLGWVSNSCSFL